MHSRHFTCSPQLMIRRRRGSVVTDQTTIIMTRPFWVINVSAESWQGRRVEENPAVAVPVLKGTAGWRERRCPHFCDARSFP